MGYNHVTLIQTLFPLLMKVFVPLLKVLELVDCLTVIRPSTTTTQRKTVVIIPITKENLLKLLSYS